MNLRRSLLKKFEELPHLINERLQNSNFQFPKRIDAPSGVSPDGPTVDVSIVEHRPTSDSDKPISMLRDALRASAGKLRFAATSIERWERTLQFAASKVRRRGQAEIVEIAPSPISRWSEGSSVNLSAECANDWFNNNLLIRLVEGTPYCHRHVILGGQGCGKSTLIKYIISKNAANISARGIVFSRFEFMKFWDEWRNFGSTLCESVEAYMSFIHLRDLIMSRFFDLVDGDEFRPKILLNRASRDARAKEVRAIAIAMRRQGMFLDFVGDEEVLMKTVEQCLSCAENGNHELMVYLRSMTIKERTAMIGALWGEKRVVTIFDGMDSLHLEDAFQDTKQWKAVKEIISNRQRYAVPRSLCQQGVVPLNDSIIVMRQSTAALLEHVLAGESESLGLEYHYYVAPINSRAAMVSVIKRALEDLPPYSRLPIEVLERDTFRLVKVLQRTMLAIGRIEGGSTSTEDIYNLFEGNLRDLFRFVSDTLEWSCNERLQAGDLHHDVYFHGDLPKLIEALSSDGGADFLRKKSYRVVEHILLRQGSSFENAVDYVRPNSELIRTPEYVRANPKNFGQIDNIFNYLNEGVPTKVDRHGFLEKIRMTQLLWSEPILENQLAPRMKREFGYEPWNRAMLVKLMLKTNFLAADIHLAAGECTVWLKSTSKAKLCVNSLIGNLAYIEHVFHRTLFPSALVEHIEDREREGRTREWAIASIRNAYVFLTYFRHIEQNAANGVQIPRQHRLFEKVRDRVIKSLERMTAALERKDDFERDPNEHSRAFLDAEEICTGALEEINRTHRAWIKSGAVAATG